MLEKYECLALLFARGNKIRKQLNCKMRGAKPREQILRKAMKLLTSINYAKMNSSSVAFVSLFIRYNRFFESLNLYILHNNRLPSFKRISLPISIAADNFWSLFTLSLSGDMVM